MMNVSLLCTLLLALFYSPPTPIIRLSAAKSPTRCPPTATCSLFVYCLMLVRKLELPSVNKTNKQSNKQAKQNNNKSNESEPKQWAESKSSKSSKLGGTPLTNSFVEDNDCSCFRNIFNGEVANKLTICETSFWVLTACMRSTTHTYWYDLNKSISFES